MRTRLQPGIAQEPWTIFKQIWDEELDLIRLEKLAIVDVDTVDPSAFRTLAWEVDLPPGELDGLSEAQIRAVLKTALGRKLFAGTRWALEKAITDLAFDEAKLTEWFDEDPAGDPFTFRVELALLQRGPNPADWPRAIEAILKAKNKRSFFASIRIAVKNQFPAPKLASFAMSLQQVRILPFITTEITTRARPHLAAFARSGMCVRIYPQGAV